MAGEKPEWITGPINANSSNNSNGKYYFETQEDGTLKPNNSGVNSTTANSYFEIDLTKYPDAELEITINAMISSEKSYDFGYATITESETAPAYNATDGRFIYVSGPTATADYTTPVIESATTTLTSQTTSQVNVTIQESGSGLSGYYISTEETTPTESSTWTEQILNEFTIKELNTGTTYYIWVKDEVGNISEKQQVTTAKANYEVDGTSYTETLAQAITQASSEGGSIIKLLNDYTDESTVAFDRNVTFDVQSYTLTRSATITINSSKTVEITGTGKITSGSTSIKTITNYGTLTISNSITIENMSTSSSNAPIYTNNSSSITNINDNVKIIGYYRGIYNYSGTVNVNGGYIEATYSNSSAYGIYNYSSSAKAYINNGEIKGYNGIYNYNSSSIAEITGGKVVGTGAYGIYARGTTNIYEGRIEGKTYGVYSNATNKVTIGKQEEELSTTAPAIYGGNCGIYMYDETYSFNFYNGVIISNTKETAYRGVVNPREGHMR